VRILQIADSYPPIIGGTERHVQTLSRELVRRGHHVTVATMSGEPEHDDEGVRVRRIGGWSRALKPFYHEPEHRYHPPIPDPGAVRELAKLTAEIRPDVVNAQSWMLYSYLPLRRRAGVPVVVTLHDYGLVCANKALLRDGDVCSGPGPAKCLGCSRRHYGAAKGLSLAAALAVSASLHRRVDRYTAVSGAVATASASMTRDTPVEIIPSFVSDDAVALMEDAPLRPAFAPAGEYAMFVGSLGHHKGLDVLLAAQSLRRLPGPLLMLVAGHGSIPGPVPEGVTIVRDVDHRDVMLAWAHATVGVVPSRWQEPFGQVAVEAMAAGRPVVASQVGGLGELVDTTTGVPVPPDDPQAVAAAIDGLMADPERRTRLGAAGRLRAQGFSASHVTGRMEELYRDVAGHAATAAPAPAAAIARS
jgi:glycosyltransferase involved in cell wall biosynthesis